MRAIIIVYSYHHHNTEKIAHAMADKLNAEVKHPQNVNAEELKSYDLIGFGAGIDRAKHYAPILELAEKLPIGNGQKVFIFSTCGVYSKKKMFDDHAALRAILESKGYFIVDEFSCVGFNTNKFLKYFGGLNRGRPNNVDLKNAADFAADMIKSVKF